MIPTLVGCEEVANVADGTPEVVQGDRIGRVLVDQFLKAPSDETVYVAGDTASAMAEEGHYTIPSCQHAIPMGKFAGYNAAASLLGEELTAFRTSPYATRLAGGGAVLAVAASEWTRIDQGTQSR